MKREIKEIPSGKAFYHQTADLIKSSAEEAFRKRGRFSLVLTGGGTVQPLYRYLAEQAAGTRFGEIWRRTDFFLGDERWVPRYHPESNGGMVLRLLLDPGVIAADRIFLVPTDLDSPEAGAAGYEKILREYFAHKTDEPSDAPQFDLVLLSMGNDGHVASLFADDDALHERKQWVTVASSPKADPPVPRITMTLPVINQSRQSVIMATGREKVALARRITAGKLGDEISYPAGMVNSAVRTIWVLADNRNH